MLGGQLFGPGGNTTPEIGSMGSQYGLLQRRQSGKGCAVPVRCPSIPAISSLCAPSAWREESTQRSALANRSMSDDDHNLDDLKDRLYRSFGVEVRPDLQVRAEIIIQPEEGRWVFTPDELRDLAHGLESILLNSSPAAGWPFRLTLKQYIGLFGPLVTFP